MILSQNLLPKIAESNPHTNADGLIYALLQFWYNQGITIGVVTTTKVAMKTAISLPDSVFEEAEALAKELGVSRSELYTQALIAHLRKYNRNQILNKLDRIYSEESSELDPVLVKMQFMSLPRENW
jgi:hypothetical protein